MTKGRYQWFDCTNYVELEKLTRFVSRSSYDSTWSTPCQFPIDHDVIQLYDFSLFVFQDDY